MDVNTKSNRNPPADIEPSDQAMDMQQEGAQPPRFSDALVVRVGEEDEASYECCRTY